jgi:hypothetical protein
MATSQSIPNTRLTGTQTFNFTNTPAGAQWGEVSIDRTVTGGLNTLTTADTLVIAIDRSTDGGTTWVPAAAITCVGGVLTTKGVTQTTESLTVGIPGTDTGFRVITTASTPVRITGTVDYTP